jgi:hypothetical protein
MSDVRIPDEKELEMGKRRPGAHGFKDVYASGGSSAANPYSLMSSFIDEAFEDGELDDNEVAGMKALARLAPNSRPARPPQDGCTTAAPAPAPVTTAPASGDFESSVNRTLDKSEDWDSGEQMARDTAQRLLGASSNQQWAFLDKLLELMSDNDLDESQDGEGAQLDAFVDGLLAINPPPDNRGGWTPGQRNGYSDALVSDYLSKAMSDGKLSAIELDTLRLLLDRSPSNGSAPGGDKPNTYLPAPNTVRPNTAGPSYATSNAQRSDEGVDAIVARGGISIEIGERAKEILRSRA